MAAGAAEGIEESESIMKRHWMVACLLLTFACSWGIVVADVFSRSVEVNDSNGVLRAVVFAANDDNKSGLEIKDNRGNVRFSVHTNNNHDPYANFIDANGKSRIELGIATNGDAYLVLKKGNGQVTHSFVAPN